MIKNILVAGATGYLGKYLLNSLKKQEYHTIALTRIPSKLSEVDVGEVVKKALDKFPKITHIPIWINKMIIALARFFTSHETYGPVEFFMTVMTRDMIAPKVGVHHLKDYYQEVLGQK